MGIGKRTAAGTVDRERDAAIEGLLEGVLRSARSHLCSAETPLAAEVWASGLLSVWGSSPDDERVFGGALVRFAQAEGSPAALATLVALAAVAPPELATKARTAAAALDGEDVPVPAWAGEVGRAQATQAWLGGDVYGDQEIVVVGYAYPSGDEHSLCVLVDHNLGGVARDAYPAAALGETLERWRDAEDDGVMLRPITLVEAAGRLDDALVATEFTAGAAGERLTDLRALLAARLAGLPPGQRTGVPELDSEARERLVAEFLSSPEAADLLSEPAVVSICHMLIDYRCHHGDGDPRRWSPVLAGLCLLDHFPTRLGLDEPDVGLVPDVLSAWVRFSGRSTGLPEAAVERTVAAVAACRSEFFSALADDEIDVDGIDVPVSGRF